MVTCIVLLGDSVSGGLTLRLRRQTAWVPNLLCSVLPPLGPWASYWTSLCLSFLSITCQQYKTNLRRLLWGLGGSQRARVGSSTWNVPGDKEKAASPCGDGVTGAVKVRLKSISLEAGGKYSWNPVPVQRPVRGEGEDDTPKDITHLTCADLSFTWCIIEPMCAGGRG